LKLLLRLSEMHADLEGALKEVQVLASEEFVQVHGSDLEVM
jgi:hypothetical protein